MWVTLRSIVHWVHSRTQILLPTLKIQKSTSSGALMYLWKPNIRPISWMCKKQTTFWDVAIEVLRSTNNTARESRPAQGNLCETGNHSSNKTEILINCQIRIAYTPTHSSQKRSQLYIFEDNEAVIKMIVKGRSPTMRHVSRTHRVALNWMFDRIKLEPKIQIKFVHTTNQLADMLIKESFTRDEWNHLLRVFNIMNFSMFFCSHFGSFLSYPNGKQSAMSERGLEAISSKGSPMPKPKPMIQAKARPINLVSHSPWGARENPSQDLRYLVNLWNVDGSQGSQTSTRKLVRTNQSPEIEFSQVRRQENSKHSDSWKQDDREESSNSTSARELCWTVTLRTKLQKMKCTNLQFITKVFHFLQRKLGITAVQSTFAFGALKTNVLAWRMFMSSSMKAAVHLGPNIVANLQICENTNFE